MERNFTGRGLRAWGGLEERLRVVSPGDLLYWFHDTGKDVDVEEHVRIFPSRETAGQRSLPTILSFFCYTTFSGKSGLLGAIYGPGGSPESSFLASGNSFRRPNVVGQRLGKLAFYH